MKYRKLRIAWSVAWGIAAVLLISLWVQSYWSRSSVSGKIANCFVIVETQHGEAMVNVVTHYTNTLHLNWHSRPIPSEDSPSLPKPKGTRGRFGIYWWPYRNGGGCMIFLLWPVMVLAAIGALSFMSTAIAA